MSVSLAAWIAATITALCALPLAAVRWRGRRPDAHLYLDTILLLLGIAVVANVLVALSIGNYSYASHQHTYIARNLEWAITSPLFLLVAAEMVARLERRRLRFIDIAMAMLATTSIFVWLFAVFALATDAAGGTMLFACAGVGIAGVAAYVGTLAHRVYCSVTLDRRASHRLVDLLILWAVLFLLYPGIYQLYLMGWLSHDARVISYVWLDVMERGLVNLALLDPVILAGLALADRRPSSAAPSPAASLGRRAP